MSDKNPAFKFTTNVPVRLKPQFVDVRPGKLWEGKQLPAQVSIKGTFDGVATIAFLPGPVWKNLKALAEAGLIAPHTKDMEDPAQPLAVKLLTTEEFIATSAKPAGQRFEGMTYAPVATHPAQQPQSARVASPYVPPKEVAPPRQPAQPQPGFGGAAYIEGLDGPPVDESPYTEHFDPMGQDSAHDAQRFPEPARTPREEREAAGQFDKRAHENEYLALWSRVAEHHAREAKRLGFTLDGNAINRATYSIWGAR